MVQHILQRLKRRIRSLFRSAPVRNRKNGKDRYKKAHTKNRDHKDVLKQSLADALEAGRSLNLIVGAAHTQYEGWISTNIDSLNLLDRSDWESLVGDIRLDRVLAEHVWEHLSPADGITALKNVAAHLKPGGRVRIAVPDGHHPDPDYIEHVRPGGTGPGADDHHLLYTAEILESAMREAGLVPEVLEHWDAEGRFHAKEWDAADGKVIRSKRFDPRNTDGKLKYTSLIVDGIKAV